MNLKIVNTYVDRIRRIYNINNTFSNKPIISYYCDCGSPFIYSKNIKCIANS